jgi:hypothetical protein
MGDHALFQSRFLAGVEVLCPAGPPNSRNPTSGIGAQAAENSTLKELSRRAQQIRTQRYILGALAQFNQDCVEAYTQKLRRGGYAPPAMYCSL